jgi:hypothetical protein
MFNMRTLGFSLLFGFLYVITLSLTKVVSSGLTST